MKLFGTWYWGFDPDVYPFAGFSTAGARDRLIRDSLDGDRLVVVATNNPAKVERNERRRLLGMLEFERVAIDVNAIYDPGFFPRKFHDENGQHVWPHAVPIRRAWRFEPAPVVNRALGRNLASAARISFETFGDEDSAILLAVPHVEIDVAELPALRPSATTRIRGKTSGDLETRLRADRMSGQPGPPPSNWSAQVSHAVGPTQTYLAQFGDHNAWKVGISQSPKKRMVALNFSIPRSVVAAEWTLRLTQEWPDGRAAYDMEQAILRDLSDLKPQNEQVACPPSRIHAAWKKFAPAQKASKR